ELVAAHVGVEPVVLLQRRLPLVAGDHGVDGRDERVALLGRDARRRHDTAPVGDVEVHALLHEGGGVDAVDTLRRGDRQHAQLTGLDLAGPLGVARYACGDLTTEDGREGLAAARVRDVVDGRRVYAGLLGQQPDEDVVYAAGGAA